MRDYTCPNCHQHLAFENSVCLGCGGAVGFSPADREFLMIGADFQLCANLHLAQCNWVVRDHSGNLCRSCRLTRTRPADHDLPALPAFAEAEKAKRRLLADLDELGLAVVGRDVDPVSGLAFDLLSSAAQPVVTGYDAGVITVDLAEGDDVHREWLRVQMGEPYRTLLGHLRHEIGHYFFSRLVGSDPHLREEFTALFGDPGADYGRALHRNYTEGPPPGWQSTFVSAYAATHPAEDWAETFAHYLHLRSVLQTAAAYGLAQDPEALRHRGFRTGDFRTLIDIWLPLAWSLNMVSRSMGNPDLYPFVLADPVQEKMQFIHDVIAAREDHATGPAQE